MTAVIDAKTIQPVNIASREFKANPFPFYARLRAEAPVFRVTLPDKTQGWLITRYDDVQAVLKDDKRFIKNFQNAMSKEQLAKMPWVPPMFRFFLHNLLGVDGADHMRLRGLVHKAFTPQMVEQIRQRAQAITNELLDKAESKGRFDLISEFALPLPLTVISELLGVTPKDRDKFGKWSRTMMELSAQSAGILLGIPNIMAMSRFIRRLAKERRANPGDDLLSALVQAEDAGQKLSEAELLSMVLVLLLAGHETTVNLIGSGTLALLENPDQFVLLRQQPELVKSAVEEIVRYVSPVEQATERYATEDVVMHDVTIRKGELVLAVIASADRDEKYFDNPDQFDIRRENNKHLAFGLGVHYCVGAPLARLEGQIAITTLVQRLPNLRLATKPEALRWRPGLTTRGLQALPVAL